MKALTITTAIELAVYVYAGDECPAAIQDDCYELAGSIPRLCNLCMSIGDAHDFEPGINSNGPLESCTPESQPVLDNFNKRSGQVIPPRRLFNEHNR
ncbi:MAG: hypothetical protein ACR2PZ_00615 [Pseudomonadales bacterium]